MARVTVARSIYKSQCHRIRCSTARIVLIPEEVTSDERESQTGVYNLVLLVTESKCR